MYIICVIFVAFITPPLICEASGGPVFESSLIQGVPKGKGKSGALIMR